MLFDGQSLNYSPAGTETYPVLTMRPIQPRHWWVVGESARSWTVLTGSRATRYSAGKIGNGGPIIAVLNGGQSDVIPVAAGGEGNTGAQAFADLLTYIAALKANGVDYVIVTTMGPMSEPAWVLNQNDINAYNVLVRAGHASIDAVVDLAAIPGLQNPNDLAAYSDGVHYTLAGATLAADAVRPAVQAAIASF